MNRLDFMKQLESLLQSISPGEREEALQYYNDYFNDAGVENEQDVIEALGNPAKVAETIKKDLYGSGYGESVFQRESATDRAVVEYKFESKQEGGNYSGATAATMATEEKKDSKLSTGVIVLIVIAAICVSPAILGVVTGLIGTVLGLVIGWFALIVGFGFAALILFIVMFALVVAGIPSMVIRPWVGVGLIGGGLLCGGIGILFLMLTVAMAGIATPAIIKGIKSLWNTFFKRKEV